MSINEMLEIIDEVNEEQEERYRDEVFFSELEQRENEEPVE